MPSLGPGIAALAARTNLCPEPRLRVYQRRQAVRVGPTRRFAAASPPANCDSPANFTSRHQATET